MASKFSNILEELKSNPNISKSVQVMQDLLDGNILMRKYFRRQYGVLLLWACFLILYIGNRYTVDREMRQKRELVKEIEDLRFELLSLSAQLTVKSRGSVVEDSVKALIPELEVSREPVIIIEEQEE